MECDNCIGAVLTNIIVRANLNASYSFCVNLQEFFTIDDFTTSWKIRTFDELHKVRNRAILVFHVVLNCAHNLSEVMRNNITTHTNRNTTVIAAKQEGEF